MEVDSLRHAFNPSRSTSSSRFASDNDRRATFTLSGEPRLDSGQLALSPGLESLEMFHGLPRVSLSQQPLFVFGQILYLEEFRQMRLRSLDLFPVHAKLIQERDRLLVCLGDGSLS